EEDRNTFDRALLADCHKKLACCVKLGGDGPIEPESKARVFGGELIKPCERDQFQRHRTNGLSAAGIGIRSAEANKVARKSEIENLAPAVSCGLVEANRAGFDPVDILLGISFEKNILLGQIHFDRGGR